MRADDRLAQRQSQPHPPAAVGNLAAGCIKQIENSFLHGVGNSRPVVGHLDDQLLPFQKRTDGNPGTFRCILDRVVDQVDDHLHHQLGINPHQYDLRTFFMHNVMLAAVAADMLERFGDDFLHQFGL